MHKLKKAARTRWLSLDTANEAVYKEYTYLLHAFRSIKGQEWREVGPTSSRVLKNRLYKVSHSFICFEIHVTLSVTPEQSVFKVGSEFFKNTAFTKLTYTSIIHQIYIK